jgi:hypothetical protein
MKPGSHVGSHVCQSLFPHGHPGLELDRARSVASFLLLFLERPPRPVRHNAAGSRNTKASCMPESVHRSRSSLGLARLTNFCWLLGGDCAGLNGRTSKQSSTSRYRNRYRPVYRARAVCNGQDQAHLPPAKFPRQNSAEKARRGGLEGENGTLSRTLLAAEPIITAAAAHVRNRERGQKIARKYGASPDV